MNNWKFWLGISRNLVWAVGHCERFSAAQAASGFEAMDLLIKESGLLRKSQNGGFSQPKCQAEDRVHSLVFKSMATHVHVLGDGCVYLFFPLPFLLKIFLFNFSSCLVGYLIVCCISG